MQLTAMRSKRRALRNGAWLLFLVSILPLTTFAQPNYDASTPAGLSRGAPAGSYALSGFDNVNLFNGHMNFNLPLLTVGGRGGASHTIMMPIEQVWTAQLWDVYNQLYVPNYNWWDGIKPGYGSGVLQARHQSEGCPDGEMFAYTYGTTRLTFTLPDGTEHELIDTSFGGEPTSSFCDMTNFNPQNGTSRGTTWVTRDGSAATFISDQAIRDVMVATSGPWVTFPSGYVRLADGTTYRVVNGHVQWFRDRNGNRISFEYTNARVSAITDSLNRRVTIEYDVQDATYGLCDRFTFKGFGGATRLLRVLYKDLQYALDAGQSIKPYGGSNGLFPELYGSSSTNHNPRMISGVVLPDGRSYQFLYNSYGELTKVTLPTGGVFTYVWGPGVANAPPSGGASTSQIYRRVLEKRTYSDNGSTLAGFTSFGRYDNIFGTEGSVIVQQRSIDGNATVLSQTKHYFHSGPMAHIFNSGMWLPSQMDGKEKKTERFDQSGSTVLDRTTSTWAYGGTVAGTSINPHVTEVVATIEPATTNLVSKQTISYDTYNNQTDVYEYGFGTGAAGALVRRTQSEYLTTNPVNGSNYATNTSIHIRTLLKQRQVFEGSVLRSKTTYEYDNYAAVANHAALVNRSNISGLDAAYTTSYVTRGNPTATTGSLLNTSGSETGTVATYQQYDIAGNVVKSIDGRGTATDFDFADRYGTPDNNAQANSGATELGSQVSYAFTTKVTNALAHISYVQFDYYLGQPVNAEDVNGVVASFQYSDALDRPTHLNKAIGTGAASQTVFAYDDSNRIITTSRDLHALNDGLLITKLLYDGLGRTAEERQYEGGGNYIATQTQYDALDRPFRTSDPFRPWQSQTALWTTQTFDALGRLTSVTTPDNAVITTSYSGNTMTATDQAGRARKSVTDALGRVVEVYEDPSGLNYQTTYLYDVLDNLVKVTQGSQLRFFMYDSLNRLIRVRNPEQGTLAGLNLTDSITGNSAWSIGYQYDGNGNVTLKTDPRGVTSTYVYDVLSRNSTVDYSDTASISPDVKRFYDGATNGKGRFWYNYAGGDASVGSNVEHTSVDSYDAQGRPLVQRQLFKLNSTWSPTYQVSRAYNRADGVTSQTYPSGRVVTYNYDNAGRLADKDGSNLAFTGNLGDGVQRTYSSGITYNSRNSLSIERFGTQTPLYHKRQYNIRGQLWDVRVATGSDVNGSWNRGALQMFYEPTYTHGASGPTNNGNVLKTNHYVPLDETSSTWAIHDQFYSYDSLNRITSTAEYFISSTQALAQQSLQTYTYDRWGNRNINSGQTWGTGVNNKVFTIDTATNRLGVPGGQPGVMSYDNAGNLTTDSYTGAGNRTYDAENRMVTSADIMGQTSRYTYNADGQRTRRQVAGSQEQWHILGFDQELLAEYRASAPASSPEKEYGYRNGQLLVTATGRFNVALAANGAVATASTTATGSGFTTTGAINGNYRGPWGNYLEGWNDNTPNSVPDWIQIDFAGSKSIDEISVFSLHDNYTQENTPTETQTFSLYGLLAFDVQYWNGSSWVTIPGGSVTGNNKVWRKFTFSAITTSKIRVYINTVPDAWSRVVEIQAFGTSAGGEKVQWLVPDHLGTPRIVVDETGNRVNVKRHDYLPFGEELFAGTAGRTAALGYAGDGVRQQFTAKERDVETGLDYFGTRYYGSLLGRFSSIDDVLNDTHPEEPQSWNLYTYVRNSPLRFIDPDGRIKRDAQGKVIFEKDREATVEYKKDDVLKKNGEVVKDAQGRAMTFTITWKAEQGTVKADNGRKIEATRATGEMEVTVKNGDGQVNEQMTAEVKQMLADGGASNTSNCHGETFASGEVWINNDQVKKLIENDGYTKTDSPQAGDVGIYTTTEGDLRTTVHSVSVNALDGQGKVTNVISKGGITARVNVGPGPGPGTAWRDESTKILYFTKRTSPARK